MVVDLIELLFLIEFPSVSDTSLQLLAASMSNQLLVSQLVVDCPRYLSIFPIKLVDIVELFFSS